MAAVVGLLVIFSFYVRAVAPKMEMIDSATTAPEVTIDLANEIPKGLKEARADGRKTEDEKNAMLEEAIRKGALDEVRAFLEKEKEEAKATLEKEKKEGETVEL